MSGATPAETALYLLDQLWREADEETRARLSSIRRCLFEARRVEDEREAERTGFMDLARRLSEAKCRCGALDEKTRNALDGLLTCSEADD